MTPAHSIAAVALWQSSEVSGKDVHWIMIALLIISAALIIAAVGMVLTSVFAARLLHSVNCVVKEAKEYTGPMLAKTSALVDELGPKIHHLTENAEQISYTVRGKVDELSATVTELNRTVQEVNERARRQAGRVDGIITDALTTTAEVSHAIQDGIRGPIRQVVGIVAGLRAGLEKLVERSPFTR